MTFSRIATFTIASAVGLGALLGSGQNASAGMFMDAAKAAAHRAAERAVDRTFQRIDERLKKHGIALAPVGHKQTSGTMQGGKGSPAPKTEVAEAPQSTHAPAPAPTSQIPTAPQTQPSTVEAAPAPAPAPAKPGADPLSP